MQVGGKCHYFLDTMDTLSDSSLFLDLRRNKRIVCISLYMSNYAYQIQGALENPQGLFLGLRVLVCDVNNFESVDVPVEVLDSETARYIQFRLNINQTIDIQKLPVKIQNSIRTPLGRWLDHWVVNNFYGYTSNIKSTNT